MPTSWPSTLPLPTVQGYGIRPGEAILRTEMEAGPAGEVMIDVFVEQMEMHMSRKIGRGEGLAPTLERRYGLNPAAGAYR
jgi:hypothetical protein